MNEKVKLLLIGTIASAMVSLFTLLVSSYFGDYALKAEVVKQVNYLEKRDDSNKNKLQILINNEKAEREKQAALIQNNLRHLKNGQDEMKQLIKSALRRR